MQIVLKAQCALLACFTALASLQALAQTVTVTPTSLSFGNQVEGTTSSVRKVTLKNGQSSAITITSITSNLSDYAATNNCPVSPTTLAAAATCTISITFKPSALGARSGTLTVADSGGSSPQLVTLSGTGTAPSLVSISVTPAAPSVAAGHTEQFTATGTYSNGTKQNLTSTASWTSSATTIATVSSGGLATSLAQGTATITATSGTITGTATLTVTAVVLASIAVTPGTASVAAGYTQQFTATGTYSNGTTQNLTGSATWTSSSTTIATVSSGGLATGVGQGSATITATSGTIHGSARLTVTARVLTAITLAPASPSVPAGEKQQFTATGTYSNGTTQNLTGSATWTSSAATIATVSRGGLATSLAQGTTTIAATSGTIQGSTALTVTAPVLTSISVTPAAPSVAAGHTEQFTATGTYSNGTKQNLTSTALDFVGGDDRDREQRRTGHEPGSGNHHDHSHLRNDPGLRHADGHGAGIGFHCSDSGHRIGGSRVYAAIRGDGDVQQRDDAELDQHGDLDFVGGDDRDCGQRRTGYECGSGNHRDHSYLRNDPGFHHADGHGVGIDIDCRDSRRDIGRSGVHAAIHRDGNVQQRDDAELD